MKLSIPRACRQSWNDMHPDGRGRFCDHCQKTVTDFSTMSDAAVLAYIQQHDMSCGRFREDQLGHELIPDAAPKPRLWQRILLTFGLFLSFQKQGAAQDVQPAAVKPPTVLNGAQDPEPQHFHNDEVQVPPAGTSAISCHAEASTDTLISVVGVLTDSRGEPLASASIMLNNKIFQSIGGSITDFDGNYVIKPLDQVYAGQTVTITGSYQGERIMQELILAEGRNVCTLKMPFSPESERERSLIVGMYVRIRYTPWQRMKHMAYRLLHYRKYRAYVKERRVRLNSYDHLSALTLHPMK